eukprot:gnl/Chilomastix_cuspidata/3523.p1 GENE.gnl/Chilomastix_cuspidata/3523~~gnl/Chilomastix_cuspidata/3523.p1  ORF type:complete len:208 (+),score=87.69 gnl/Chilomastix_cuspidata/3523:34-657(+)
MLTALSRRMLTRPMRFSVETPRVTPNRVSIPLVHDLPHFDEPKMFHSSDAEEFWLADEVFKEFPQVKAIEFSPGVAKLTVPDAAWNEISESFVPFFESKVLEPLDMWDRLALLDEAAPTYPSDLARVLLDHGVSRFLGERGGSCEFMGVEFLGADRTCDAPLDVHVRLGGALAGCAHASEAAVAMILDLLRNFFPAIRRVRDVGAAE